MSIKYPIYITILLLVIVLILWFIPDKLGLINESYNIEIFRSDLKDFALSTALDTLNKACFDLHKGVTWSEVEIALEAKINRACK